MEGKSADGETAAAAAAATTTFSSKALAAPKISDDEQKQARSAGARGRRGTVCAMPVNVETSWKPSVFEKVDSEKKRLKRVLREEILFQHLEERDMDLVVDAMQLKTFDDGEIVIQQGDVGDYFYVVESGRCDIFVRSDDEDDGSKYGHKVQQRGPGQCFGELALMYDAPRAATVVAVCEGEDDAEVSCWAVDQVTFKKTIQATTMKRREMHEGFLSRTAIFDTLSHEERALIADALNPSEFSAGEVIVREFEHGDVFYLIEEGEVKCTKEDDDGEVCRRLGPGDYFGEVALLTDNVRRATVTATKNTRCQTLDRPTFTRLLGSLEVLMRDHMQIYEQYKVILEEEGTDTRELEAAIEDVEGQGGNEDVETAEDGDDGDNEARDYQVDEGKRDDVGKRAAYNSTHK